LRDVQEAAPSIGLNIQILNASTIGEIDTAFATLARERPERTNSFTFEIKLKLDGERAVSALTNRRISLSNKSSSTP
jgi:hypothetical protein